MLMRSIFFISSWLILTASAVYSAQLTHNSYQTGHYIISFKTPALGSLSHDNNSKQKLDNHLITIKNEQQAFIQSLHNRFNKSYQPLFEYHFALNAISMTLTLEEVEYINTFESVLHISKEETLYPATDASASMINADQLWNGQAIAPLPGVQGEDVIIGVIDTGINFTHESFSDSPEDMYDFASHNPFNPDTYIGWCDPNHPQHQAQYTCNNKVIGAWDFVDVFGNESDGPIDSNFHGSSMSGIISGNKITAPDGGFVFSFNGGILDAPYISGIAPHSHLIIYDVCDNTSGCPGSAVLAAIEQAIIDGVDIINLALNGGANPWSPNSVAFALLNANNQGIITSSAAGNATAAQPITLGRVNNLAPWLLTAANSYHGRTLSNDVSILDPIPVPDFLTDLYAVIAEGVTIIADLSAEISYAYNIDPANEFGCLIWPPSTFDNSIALIKSGNCDAETKIQLAEDAGAIAVIIFSADSDIPTQLTGINTPMIPAVMLGQTDAENIIAHINNVQPMPTIAQILAETSHKVVDALGMVLYHSSLTGPNDQFNISKPDLSAPGTNIFAAIAELGQVAPQYFTATGTSQSAATISGALALFKNIHPDWTPSEIKSAMMLTANDNMTDEDGNAVTSDEIGSGMLDLSKAVNTALVMDESFANYVAADPDNGGNEASLNLASLRDNHCSLTCSWQRTFTNKSQETRSWSISTASSPDSLVTVTPTQFTLNAEESITINIDFMSKNLQINEHRFARVLLSDDSEQTPLNQLTLTVYLDDLIFQQGFE